MKMIRQGDVLLIRRDQAPTVKPIAPEGDRYILAHGEATGHHHSVLERPGSTGLYAGPNNSMWLLVQEGDALLEHQEHSALTVPPGIYEVRRQRESEDGSPDWRFVKD